MLTVPPDRWGGTDGCIGHWGWVVEMGALQEILQYHAMGHLGAVLLG